MMKKYLSITLIIVLILSVSLFGCSKSDDSENTSPKGDYIINSTNVINIGVVAPMSGENSVTGMDVVEGVKFARSLADVVNIDQKYIVNLFVCDSEEGVDKASEQLISENVAAVICAGTDSETTDLIISAFSSVNTPLIFTDNFSDSISTSDTSYSISVPYTHQASIASAYFLAEGYYTGLVICENNNHSLAYANNFKEIFESAGGQANITQDITYNGEDFIFIIGSNTYSYNAAIELRAKHPDTNILLSEVFNKNRFETEELNNIMFLSKFEIDVENNHIGTDFINMYSNMKEVSSSDISSAVGYGYDAYMLIYGALAKCNPNSGNNLTDSESNDNPIPISVSQVNSLLKSFVHYGVTDNIVFNEYGYVDTKFIYLDKVENSKAAMYNRYVY